MVSTGVSRLEFTERREQMGFRGCVLIVCYIFTSQEVHSVQLFHSVCGFFNVIRTKNHETKIRYVSYKVHCILLIFPPPLWLFVSHLTRYKNNQKARKINKPNTQTCFSSFSHPQFKESVGWLLSEMSYKRNEQCYKYFCISYCTETRLLLRQQEGSAEWLKKLEILSISGEGKQELL